MSQSSVSLDDRTAGETGTSRRVREEISRPLTPRFQNQLRSLRIYNPSPYSVLVATAAGRPLEDVCAGIIRTCALTSIEMECCNETVSAELLTPERVRMRIALWSSAVNERVIVVSLDQKWGEADNFSRYSTYFQHALTYGTEALESAAENPFPQTNIQEQLDKKKKNQKKKKKAGRLVEPTAMLRRRQRAVMDQLYHIAGLLLGRFGAMRIGNHVGFLETIEDLEYWLDASKVGIEATVYTSLAILLGKPPVEETVGGNRSSDICSGIAGSLGAALLTSDLGSQLFATGRLRNAGVPVYQAMGFLSPIQFDDYRTEVFRRLLSVNVNALEILTNAWALAVAGGEGWVELGEVRTRAFVDFFADVLNNRYGTNPTEAALAAKGARHLAASSIIALDLLQRALPRASLLEAYRFGNERHAMLREQTELLLERLYPEEVV